MRAIRYITILSLLLLLFTSGVYFGKYVAGSTQPKATAVKNKKVTKIAHPIKKNKPIIVAIIDTGIASYIKDRLGCKYGHRDFTGQGLDDEHGHGTMIAGTIDQYVKDAPFSNIDNILKIQKIKANYCQVYLKYYHTSDTIRDAASNLEKALRWAIDIKVDYINYSGGGTGFNPNEATLIKEALDKGIKVIAAAGNESCHLNGECFFYYKDENGNPILNKKGEQVKIKTTNKYYPAMVDERIYVVGNLDSTMKRAPSSNYGDVVDYWEMGSDILSYSLKEDEYVNSTGTSQAAAIKTGKLVRETLLHRH